MSENALIQPRSYTHGSGDGFEFTESDFNYLRDLIGSYAGIHLSDCKRDLVYGRLARRLRAIQLDTFREYRVLLKSNDSGELEHFVNALTTNLTSFFREKHHFEFLKETIVPGLMKQLYKGEPLRIWSAGCSTGPEPYSIAMVLAEAIPGFQKHDIRILATDLDTDVVRHAANGIYTLEQIDGLSAERRDRWFMKGSGSHAGKAMVSDKLKKIISFLPLNLMQPWPMKGLFDLIFCRNVVIYFEKSTQCVLFDRFADMLKPDRHLIIGHSETLTNVSERFELINKTIYRNLS